MNKERRNFELRIRIKAILIYAVAAAGVVSTVVYLDGLRRKVSEGRRAVEQQRGLLEATNELIFYVNRSQESAGLYLSDRRRADWERYAAAVDSIDRAVERVARYAPQQGDRLVEIGALLDRQFRLLDPDRTARRARPNPVARIREQIEAYVPPSTEQVETVHVRTDTVWVPPVKKKGFFRRLADAFRPPKDSVRTAVSQRFDTVRTAGAADTASSVLISEVGAAAAEAQQTYEQSLLAIARRANRIVVSSNDISARISVLLSELYKTTFASTLSLIEQSEEALHRNYLYSTIGGGVALVLIAVFVGLIVADTARGRRARVELEAAHVRMRQIMESRHRLLLSVSHDIKSPLGSMCGYLEAMPDGPQVRSMRNSAAHILSMLENLLEFSSLEQGTLQPNPTEFDLRALFDEVHTMFVPLAGQKQIEWSAAAPFVHLRADRTKIKQAVINLVSNAVKYTPRGGSVGLRAQLDSGTLRIEVRDTGVGISQEQLPQLFQPFNRLEGSRSLAEGSGFGLFVVKGLVELLGGRIEVRSEVDTGTEVEMRLPVGLAAEPNDTTPKRIRIYEDDPASAEQLRRMVERLGYRAVGQADECDLVLTDMEMGAVSGSDILEQIGGSAPVVVVTGRGDFSTARAAAMGFAGYVEKPLTEEALRAVVGSVAAASDDLWGDDRDEIEALFRASARGELQKLREALAADDFDAAQAVCHKLYPMCAQLGYPTSALERMNARRGAPYGTWRQDAERVLLLRV